MLDKLRQASRCVISFTRTLGPLRIGTLHRAWLPSHDVTRSTYPIGFGTADLHLTTGFSGGATLRRSRVPQSKMHTKKESPAEANGSFPVYIQLLGTAARTA